MKKQEFLDEQESFRATWNSFFALPEEDRKGTDMEPQSVTVLKTCRTEGCAWKDLSEEIKVDIPGDGVYKVLCVSCMSAVEDLDPMLEDDEDYRLPTKYSDGSSWLKAAW